MSSQSQPVHTSPDRLDELFPIPSPPLSPTFPLRWPGITAKSSKALSDSLKQDFLQYHIFFKDETFHNHNSHHFVALYCLGANGALIHAASKYNERVQIPAYESPAVIDASTFHDYLGDPKFYASYLRFFVDQILDKGIGSVLEEYVFSDKANVHAVDGKQPFMLARFLDALVHPIIHVGGGTELNLPGLVAEGLALTAVHQSDDAVIFPPSVFSQSTTIPSVVAGMRSGFSTLSTTILSSPAPTYRQHHAPSGIHALTILARAMKDPLLNPPKEDYHGALSDLRGDEPASKAKLARVVELSEQWGKDIDLSAPEMLEAKIEELAWFTAIVYGVGGWSPSNKPFWADFFTMHLVTSSVFLPSVCHHLSPSSQTRLLRAYFAVSLGWYVTRGRPQLDIAGFFGAPEPSLRGQEVSPHRRALKPDHFDHKTEAVANPWLALVQSANYALDPHVVKAQRALAHWAQRFGDRPAGFFASLGLAQGSNVSEADALPGVEKIDGSLFVRAAILTQNKLGWVREGEEEAQWDFFGTPPPVFLPDP